MKRLEIAVLAAALLGGCAGGEDPSQRISYTASESSAQESALTGIDEQIEMVEDKCLGSGGGAIKVVRPATWQTTVEAVDGCKWDSESSGHLEFVRGDFEDAWKHVVAENQSAQFDGDIEGYDMQAMTKNKQGGPLWHYRYTEERDGGTVTVDSYNVFRGKWRLTYTSESSRFNEFIARKLLGSAAVVG